MNRFFGPFAGQRRENGVGLSSLHHAYAGSGKPVNGQAGTVRLKTKRSGCAVSTAKSPPARRARIRVK
jgi:hypothetical protein